MYNSQGEKKLLGAGTKKSNEKGRFNIENDSMGDYQLIMLIIDFDCKYQN